MRIVPNQENIGGKIEKSSLRNDYGYLYYNEIKRKIDLQFCFLANQSVEHGFVGTID